VTRPGGHRGLALLAGHGLSTLSHAAASADRLLQSRIPPVYRVATAGVEGRVEEIKAIPRAYRSRETSLSADPRVKLVLVFRDQGERGCTPWTIRIPR
jgi:hypothetical protein